MKDLIHIANEITALEASYRGHEFSVSLDEIDNTPKQGDIGQIEIEGVFVPREVDDAGYEIDKVTWVRWDDPYGEMPGEPFDGDYRYFLRKTGLRDKQVRELLDDHWEGEHERWDEAQWDRR